MSYGTSVRSSYKVGRNEVLQEGLRLLRPQSPYFPTSDLEEASEFLFKKRKVQKRDINSAWLTPCFGFGLQNEKAKENTP